MAIVFRLGDCRRGTGESGEDKSMKGKNACVCCGVLEEFLKNFHASSIDL